MFKLDFFRLLRIFLIIPWLINVIIPFAMFWVVVNWFQIMDDSLIRSIMEIGGTSVILACYLALYAKVLHESNPELNLKLSFIIEIKVAFQQVRERPVMVLMILVGSFLLPQINGFLGILFDLERAELPNMTISILIPLFIGPIVEELFFRKALLSYCQNKGIKNYALYSVLFFLLIHGYDFSLGSLFLILSRVLFILVFLTIPYLLTSALIIPVMAHIAWNISVIVFGFLDVSTASSSLIVVAVISAFVIIYISIHIFTKFSTYRKTALPGEVNYNV